MEKVKTVSDKPYNRCLACKHRESKQCDGPRTSAMKLDRWCEFMKAMKEANGLTNAYVAEKSGVSVKTIERIMALNCDHDIMRETCRLIEDAIIGSSNQYPCYLAFEESLPNTGEKLNDALRELERVVADNEDYRKALDSIHNSYREEMRQIREEADKTISFLKAQLERTQRDNDYLWAENNRKSKVVDMFLENKHVTISQKQP